MSSITSPSFSDTLPPGSEEHLLQFEDVMFISIDKWQQQLTPILNQSPLMRHVFHGYTTGDLLSITILQKELRGIKERKRNLLTLRKGIITTMIMLDPNLIILAKVKERI